jgi:N6-L-threonylcarbamoyladenine synthase
LKEAEQNTVGKPIPKFEYTTDNAAMIGVGYQKFLSHKFETSTVVSKARIQF